MVAGEISTSYPSSAGAALDQSRAIDTRIWCEQDALFLAFVLTMVAPPSSEGLQMPAGWRVSANQRNKVLADLGTDEERLDIDARSIRAWVNMQPHLPFLPESEITWIKHYLLCCKNSMEKTKQGLDQYYTARTAHYDFFGRYNINEEELIKYGKFMSIGISKELTPGLRRVLVARNRSEEQTEEDFSRMCRLNLLKADALIRMDVNAGYEVVLDQSDFTPGNVRLLILGLNVLKTFLACVLGSVPARVNHVHIINSPSSFRTAFSLLQPLLKEKLKNRVTLHEDLKSLYSHVPPQYLPKDLGGDLPSCEEMEAEFRPVLSSFASHYAVQRTLKVDESKRPGGPSKMHADAQFGCEGSFRRMALD
ncbi:clavesin-2-like [Thrips palmi]|uniref:Clavesin-2-like n=1 Tax=Thrips palmi TaxID=161013 RepID=A0A6P8YRG1_THRPL|nr:clavesin-2-like [Thrips palmi]